jgi:hypothetical protein
MPERGEADAVGCGRSPAVVEQLRWSWSSPKKLGRRTLFGFLTTPAKRSRRMAGQSYSRYSGRTTPHVSSIAAPAAARIRRAEGSERSVPGGLAAVDVQRLAGRESHGPAGSSGRAKRSWVMACFPARHGDATRMLRLRTSRCVGDRAPDVPFGRRGGAPVGAPDTPALPGGCERRRVTIAALEARPMRPLRYGR